jgi:Uma2 family endonuclease
MILQRPPLRSIWTEEERAEIKRAIAELRVLLPLYERTGDPAVYAEIERLTELLPAEDGIPMEFFWHYQQMRLLVEMTQVLWHGRTDYVVGGNNFIYYSLDQAEAVVDDVPTAYRGPDFFIITGVDPSRQREKWVGWMEGYKYPDLIIELLSKTTAAQDRTIKKEIYQNIFRTQEYFWYHAYRREFEGFELVDGVYVPKARNERGWMWSDVLGVWVGVYPSVFDHRRFRWLRFIYPDGTPVPHKTEWFEAQQRIAEEQRRLAEEQRLLAEQARQQAEQERLRAEQATADLERLKQRLRELGVDVE